MAALAADAPDMIAAETAPDIAGIVARLTAKAKSLAQARLESAELTRRSDPVRWRKPGLLWPLFTKG